MKFLISLSFLLLGSNSFAGNIGGLTPFSVTNYKCKLIASDGDNSILRMNLKEYIKTGSPFSNWAQLKLDFDLPMDLHQIERDPVAIYPSIEPLVLKNTAVKIANSILTAGDSRESALSNLFSESVLPIHFLLSTYIGNTWEEPVIRFSKVSKEHVSFSIQTLERHNNTYVKLMDVNGNCEIT